MSIFKICISLWFTFLSFGIPPFSSIYYKKKKKRKKKSKRSLKCMTNSRRCRGGATPGLGGPGPPKARGLPKKKKKNSFKKKN
jgi:hypothetical protein